MFKKLRKAITILLVIILVLIIIISSFFIIKHLNNKQKINNILNEYTKETLQDTLENNTADYELNDITKQIDGENVLGIIEIEKINFQGLVYEGTSSSTLEKGVGHFETSPYFNGNVCMAAHNYTNVWGKLYTLKNGDKITYTSFLGKRDYKVISSTKIDETDWSLLQNTNDNLLTLITCVKGERTKRLCVQAIAIN